MTAIRRRRALALRYDGPVPPDAAIPADFAEDMETQLAARRDWSWNQVRRAGHAACAAGRAFRSSGSRDALARWKAARRDLARALRCWASFRSWALAEQGGR